MNVLIPQILRDLWFHKLRSSLAIFCIAFGVFVMTMLMALGAGFYKASERDMMNIADNTFVVWQGKKTKSYRGYPKGQTKRITLVDVIELPKIFPSIVAVSPLLGKSAVLSYAGKAYTKEVHGVTPEHAALAKFNVEAHGRFLSQIDVEQRARVAVISSKVKEVLFGKDSNVLGLRFLIDSVPFTVIGVMPKGQENKHGDNEEVFISYRSYEMLYGEINRGHFIDHFLVSAKPGTNLVQLEQLLRGYFAEKCHFDKNDKGALGFWGSSKMHESIRWFLLGIQLFLSACGLMVLAVGSIGVANIMFLIVTERTYEIGLRKAVGARDQQIFLQLLLEVLVIVGIGGVLGMMAVFFTITFLHHITLPGWLGVPTLSWSTAFITIFILALIGLVTGFFPANRAAKMDIVEALLT